ncbi:MAG: FAD-binding protein [Rhizomicrobium sp.]
MAPPPSSAKENEFTTPVHPPLVLADTERADWLDEADIVLVGFGSAAAVAGLQAREDGASVLALDRFGGGGTTAISGGIIYAGGTKYQRASGFNDTAEEMYKYLFFEGMAVQPDTLKRYCDTSAENLEWLSGHGVQFGTGVYPYSTTYPPDGYFLYYSGMEKARPEVAYVAPRGHRTVGKGMTGKNYWAAVRDAAFGQGVRLMQHSPVRRLVMDANGRVIGVECQIIPREYWKKHDALYRRVTPYRPLNGVRSEQAVQDCRAFEEEIPQQRALVRAHRAVIVASGNYTYNLKFLGRYRPEFEQCYREIVRMGTMGDDGSGVELGLSAGGQLACMDAAVLSRPTYPPLAYVTGALVNLEGRRYINEDANYSVLGQATSEQKDYAAWLIIDSRTFWKGIRQLLPPGQMFSLFGTPAFLNILFGGTRKARTIGELARKCRMSPDNQLAATIAAYNEGVAKESDALGKRAENLGAVVRGPFYAVNMSLRNKWNMSSGMPFGGLKVDEETGAIVRADGSPVPGLFACGRCTVGMSSRTTFSGLSLGDTVFSGRRAARSAVRGEIPTGHKQQLAQ